MQKPKGSKDFKALEELKMKRVETFQFKIAEIFPIALLPKVTRRKKKNTGFIFIELIVTPNHNA